MHAAVCHGHRGLCKEMIPIDGTELLRYLKNVTFEGEHVTSLSVLVTPT